MGVEEAYIVTDMGEEQEIACIVSSSPVAEVTWMKDGASLDAGAGPDTVLSRTANRHSLLIMAVSQQSVGQYSCTANNSLGEATATADISGDAHPVIVLSNHLSDHQHTHTLERSAQSESEIELFEVAVRKEGEENWKIHKVNVKVESNETNVNTTVDSVNEYHGELLLTYLIPGTSYEVTVASKNEFGLNTHGDFFTFRTKAADPKPVPKQTIEGERVPKQQPSVSTSSSTVLNSFTSLSLVLCFLLRLLK